MFFDADTLLSFACAPQALAALITKLGPRARVSQIVVRELQRRTQQHPPHPNARRALQAALHMQPIDITDDDHLDRLAALRDRLASPDDHQSQHLGESSCVLLAQLHSGIVASDDRGARALAQHAGVHRVTTAQLLTSLVRGGSLTCAASAAARDAMVRAGRRIPPGAPVC